MNNKIYKPLIIWLFTGCFLIFLMVVIGGITRLTRSGLSIVEWDLVVGTLPPLNEAQWQVQFEKYQQSPEFRKLNSHFELEDFKSIFWWEYIHRLIGRIIGIVFLVPFLYFLLKKKISKQLLPKLLLIFALGAFQGFLGWFMVSSGLINKPYVSHYRLAMHLVAAFATFAFTFWVALDEIYKDNRLITKGVASLKRVSWFFLGILSLQIIYGAFVAGLKAGYVYTTFPKMGEEWIASAVTGLEPFWRNFVEGLAGVQFIHRYIAYFLVILAIVILMKARKVQLSKIQNAGIVFLAAGIVIQFLLGVFTLVFAVPITLGVLHQVGAFFLLMAILYLLHSLKYSSDH